MSTALTDTTKTITPTSACCLPPVVISKTDTSFSLKLNTLSEKKNESGAPIYQLAYSEHGYLYYTWQYVISTSSNLVLRDLVENTCYVFKVATCLNPTTSKSSNYLWSEFSALSDSRRTFTTAEALLRTSTVYAHAHRLEKGARRAAETKLSAFLAPCRASMELSSRGSVRLVASLQAEVATHVATASQHEALIAELMAASETQRVTSETAQSSLTDDWHAQAALLKSHHAHLQAEKATSLELQHALMAKGEELHANEAEVARLMNDCQRMVMERSDEAAAKEWQLTEELNDVKAQLAQAQMQIATLEAAALD